MCLAAAAFYTVRFYTTPAAGTLNFSSETAWLNYALWRASLLPTAGLLVAAAFVTSLLSAAIYPLSARARKFYTAFMILFLEEQLAVWGSWLYSHIPLSISLWRYDPFPLLYWVTGGSVAFCFVIIACTALITVQISFKSIPRTIQIMSLSLIPLPLYVYFFDRGEFYIHFQDAIYALRFVTNYDLLIACVVIFSGVTLYELLRKLI